MMRYLLVAGMVVVIAAGVIALASRQPPHAPGGIRPPTPSAIDEGGVSETPAVPPHARTSRRVATVAKSRPPASATTLAAASEGVRAGTTTQEKMPESSVRVFRGHREVREREDGTGPPLPLEQIHGEQPARPAAASGSPPVLTPPVLLTPVAGYPAEGYRIALDRSALTPHLRVEAAQGRVVLRVLVRADGSVGQVLVVESSGSPALDEAAVHAAAGWRFVPAARNGQPVESWAIVPIRFVVP